MNLEILFKLTVVELMACGYIGIGRRAKMNRDTSIYVQAEEEEIAKDTEKKPENKRVTEDRGDARRRRSHCEQRRQ